MIVSKCPFWSTEKIKAECYNECPMNNFFASEDNCPFKEYLSNNIKFKGIEELEESSTTEEGINYTYLPDYME